jgi:putative tricarboxylic transport membrane protein
MSNDSEAGGQGGGLLRRGPEAGVALLLLAFGLIVIYDSLRVGIEWADDGPRAGYFPFFIGAILAFSSGWNLVRTMLAWRRETAIFSAWSELRDVAAMAVPMTIFIAAVPWLGLYVPGALLIGYFMRRHGSFGWLTTVAVAIGTPIVFFLVFERWFLVPLAKGPLEAWLGF